LIRKTTKDNTVYLSKEELFAFFEVSIASKHSRFKEALKNAETSFFQIKEEKDKGFEFESIVPIPYSKMDGL
jgi:plasmid replication initiation protein